MALTKKQKVILDRFCSGTTRTSVVEYEDLPAHVREELEGGKLWESLWCDATRYVNDALNQNKKKI